MLRSTRPGPLRDALRKDRMQRTGAVQAGFDLYSEEEVAKQNKRASRFGTATPAQGVPIARLSENEQAKKNRAMKFGLQYEEAERSGACCARLNPSQLEPRMNYAVKRN